MPIFNKTPPTHDSEKGVPEILPEKHWLDSFPMVTQLDLNLALDHRSHVLYTTYQSKLCTSFRDACG